MQYIWLVHPKKHKWYHKLLKLLKKHPNTWEKYEEDPMKILAMEYEELLQTTDKSKLPHELLHVAAAALYCYNRIKEED